MKKLITLMCMIMLTFSLPVTTFASSPASIVSDKAMVEKLLSDGLSQNDADYYVALDKYVKGLESKGQEINLTDAKDLDDAWVSANPVEFRNLILKGDKSAIKKAMLSQASKFGNQDIKALQEKDKKSGKTKSKYTVQYPDGSSVSLSASTVKEENIDKKVTPNTSIAGPWTNSSYMDETTNNNVSGTYNSTTTWKFTSGLYYAMVKNITNWGFDSGTNHAWLNYSTGSDGYVGIVSIGNEYLGNHLGTDSYNYSGFSSYTDVRFVVSGAFSAAYNGLGINIAAGGSWHQYAIAEIFGPFVNHWCAYAI